MIAPKPTFAVIGAVNHGKSSVVSTLSEDDEVRVSPMPGETVEVKQFRLSDLLTFYDTPGFQNARKALAEIQSAAAPPDPLARFRAFVDRHQGDPEFDAECRLLQPILAGAGVIYVVDGSLPVTDLHRCEVELVRLTAAPRLAIVNRTAGRDHVDEWRAVLAQTFNAVREFNAHWASFEDRKDLLEALANIERAWKPQLQKAVAALESDRRSRVADAAAIVTGLLETALGFSKRQAIEAEDAGAPGSAAVELQASFKADMAAMEAKAHDAMIGLFAHRLVQSPGQSKDMFGHSLFSEETWRLLGLSGDQLLAAGAVAGGLAGAGVDALTAGHTLLAGTAIGAAVGAGGAFLLGKKQPDISVSLRTASLPKAMRMLLPNKLRLSANEVVVGPLKAVNFPWILIDRALCTLVYVAGRAHGRRDAAQVKVDELQPWLAEQRLTVEHWPEADRKRCERAFAALRKSGGAPGDEARLLPEIIERHLNEVVEAASGAARPTPL
ncbi:GTPase/DUF3482 domain-containing protein [Ideonella sp.]|uniref:GTPase/DUF3482 domain-containing protein n=1 Tax=Ideonella sp. TaxID=1929293 RepID=UPI0035B02597